jgi:hypothetical protein
MNLPFCKPGRKGNLWESAGKTRAERGTVSRSNVRRSVV